jgi:putative ABC transport system permease protein
VFEVFDELKIDPKQLQAWQENRRGCVVDRRLAERRGWSIGERIPLKGTFYQYDLDLELVGLFDSELTNDSLLFHWEYLDEGLKQKNQAGSGNAGTIFIKATGRNVMPRIAEEIDSHFASSNNPTRTQTEEAFAQMFTDMLGNVQTYIRNIGLAIVFSLSLVAANAMAMSIRERTTEIAVLKAIGFSRGRVLWLVLGEAVSIAVLGGLLGVLIGCSCLQGLHLLITQFFPFSVHELPLGWLIGVFLASAGIGLASGIVPAVRAARLSVVNGLRQVI